MTSPRHLAAIMFTDMVGYSRLTQEDEALAMELLQEHWAMARPLFLEYGGREIKTIGDAFMVEFVSALQAVECAVRMQSELAMRNRDQPRERRIQIRIGIHAGDVEVVGDDAFGDGVNIAARVEPQAPPGGIAITSAVYHQVHNRIPIPFKSIGMPALKNISIPVEVFVADIGEHGSEGWSMLKTMRRSRIRYVADGISVLIIAAVITPIGIWLLPHFKNVTPAVTSKPVVAVIPFESIGEDSALFLASGLHNDLLTRLAQLGTFSVISRTSMLEYAGTTKSISQISRELGAGYVLEGGVQIVGERVRINAQLIDAATDSHLWAKTYDREYTATALFDVQAELALSIAEQLRLTLSEPERRLVSDVPTYVTAAYKAYLEALALSDVPTAVDSTDARIVSALESAVALDPNFVEAWALLARFRFASQVYPLTAKQSQELGNDALARAIALAPDRYEVGLARITELYYVKRDLEGVLTAVDGMEKRGVLTEDALVLRGKALRRLGRFEAAYQAFLYAQRLDPRDYSVAADALFTATMNRDCTAMENQSTTLLLLVPEGLDAMVQAARFELLCKVDAYRAGELLDGLNFMDTDQLWVARDAAFIRRDWDALSPLLERDTPGEDPVTNIVERLNTEMAKVWTQRHLGRIAVADSIVITMRAEVSALEATHLPANAWAQAPARLFLSAAAGEAGETRRWADKLLQANQSGTDPVQAVWIRHLLPIVYAVAGMDEDAVEALSTALSKPGDITFRFVDAHPVFDDLHDHPGYDELRKRYGSG